MKKLLLIFLSLFLFIMTGCGSSDEPTEEEQQEQINELISIDDEDEEEKDTSNQPVVINYTPSDVSPAESVGRRVTSSYFSRKLLGEEVTVYNEILEGVLNWKDEIQLMNCDEKTLIRVMNIILIDTPSAYNLEPSYSYDLVEGSDLIVNRVYPSYRFSLDEYNESLDKINNNMRPFEELIMKETPKTEALSKILKFVSDGLQKFPESEDAEIVTETTVFSLLAQLEVDNQLSINEFELTKLINLLCHHSGIDSLSAFSSSPGDKKDDLVIKYDGEDGKKHVTLNIDNYNWFNEIEINGDWYIFSALENAELLNSSSYEPESTSALVAVGFEDSALDNSFSAYLLTTDRIYSANHSYWQVDDNLGILPSCNSLEFVNAYRNGDFIPEPELNNPTDEQLSEYITLFHKQLVDNVSPKSMAESPTIVVRFPNKELYNLYIGLFSDNIKEMSSLSGRKIEDYKLEMHPEALMLVIKDFYSY